MYDVILADPAWQYDSWNTSGTGRGLADAHYPTMNTDAIAALPVGEMASDDCALFLWATWPNLVEALVVMAAWGFTYKTCAFVWVKTTKAGTAAIGTGHYTRANSEPVLFGRRGRVPVADRSVSQIIFEESEIVLHPRTRHSAKPPIHSRIERLYPGARKVELFARERVEGWQAFGNEIDGRDLRDSLPAHTAELAYLD